MIQGIQSFPSVYSQGGNPLQLTKAES